MNKFFLIPCFFVIIGCLVGCSQETNSKNLDDPEEIIEYYLQLINDRPFTYEDISEYLYNENLSEEYLEQFKEDIQDSEAMKFENVAMSSPKYNENKDFCTITATITWYEDWTTEIIFELIKDEGDDWKIDLQNRQAEWEQVLSESVELD